MTDTPDNTELTALRTHNAELLAELKAAKARAKTAEDTLQEATAAAEAAQGELQALKLDGPVRGVLDEVAVDHEVFRGLFEKHYGFRLDDAGNVAIVDRDGNPAMIDEGTTVSVSTGPSRSERVTRPGKIRPATLTAADIEALCAATPEAERFLFHIRALDVTGGGSRGSRGTSFTETTKPEPKTEPRPQFGIR